MRLPESYKEKLRHPDAFFRFMSGVSGDKLIWEVYKFKVSIGEKIESMNDFVMSNLNDGMHMMAITVAMTMMQKKKYSDKEIIEISGLSKEDFEKLGQLIGKIGLLIRDKDGKPITNFGEVYMNFINCVEDEKNKTRVEIAENMIKLGKNSKEEIAQCTGVDMETLDDIEEKFQLVEK